MRTMTFAGRGSLANDARARRRDQCLIIGGLLPRVFSTTELQTHSAVDLMHREALGHNLTVDHCQATILRQDLQPEVPSRHALRYASFEMLRHCPMTEAGLTENVIA